MCPAASSEPRELVRLASGRTRSFGALTIPDLVACARDRGIVTSSRQARAAVARQAAQFLDDEWFFLPGCRLNRLCTVSRKILAVASPLDVATIRAGVCRTYSPDALALVPPAPVIAAFYGAHPFFAVDGRRRVRPLLELDEQAELGASDRLFVDVLRSSWIGVLERDSFLGGCLARGMSARTFSARTLTSPVLDQAPGDIWFLRGTR